jgi:hypothetical protein
MFDVGQRSQTAAPMTIWVFFVEFEFCLTNAAHKKKWGVAHHKRTPLLTKSVGIRKKILVDFLLKLAQVFAVFPDFGKIALLNDGDAVIQISGSAQPFKSGLGVCELLIDFSGFMENVHNNFHLQGYNTSQVSFCLYLFAIFDKLLLF